MSNDSVPAKPASSFPAGADVPTAPWFSRAPTKFDPGLLPILAAPLLILLVYDAWIYTYPSYLDPWFYTGFMLDLGGSLRHYPDIYQGTRMAWVLPGHLLHSALPPVAANLVLHIGFCWIAAVSVYLAARRVVGRRGALAGALLMETYPQFLYEIGWNNIDCPAIAYFPLTLAVLAAAAGSSRPRRWMFAAGVAFGAMLHTNLFLVTFSPALLLYHWYVTPRRSLSAWGGDAAAGAAGLAACAVGLGAASWHFGGDFLLLRQSIVMATNLTKNPVADVWSVPAAKWFPDAIWLRVPILVLVSAGLFHLVRRLRRESPAESGAVAQYIFVLVSLVLLVWQVRGNPTLQAFWYAGLVIPAMFIAIGGQLSGALKAMPPAVFALLLGGWVAVNLVLFALPTHGDVAEVCLRMFQVNRRVHLAFSVGFPLALAAATALPGKMRRLRIAATFAFLVQFAIANCAMSHPDRGARDFKRDSYSAIVKAHAAIKTANAGGRRILLWYKATDYATGCLFTSIHSMYMWGPSRLGDDFPNLPGIPPADALVVVPSVKPGAAKAAVDTLRAAGVQARLLGEQTVSEGTITFALAFIELSPAPDH